MNKKSVINFIACIIIAIGIVIVAMYFINENINKGINEGKFRINDLTVLSTIEVEETDIKDVDIYGLSGISLNLSQTNDITISVIDPLVEDFSCYVDNVNIEYPNLYNEIVIYDEIKGNTSNFNDKIEIKKEKIENTYRFNFTIINKDFEQNLNLPEGINEVIYDGTILNTFNISNSDLIFKLSFNLNIIEFDGTKNIANINLDIPYETLGEVGMTVLREDINNFVFKIDD